MSAKDIELEHILNPTGNVFVWGRFSSPLNIKEGGIVCVYGTYDVKAFFRRTVELNIPPGQLLKCVKVADEVNEETGFPWYTTRTDIRSEDILGAVQEDVLFAGRSLSEEGAVEKIVDRVADYQKLILEKLKKGMLKVQEEKASVYDALGGSQQVRDYVSTRHVNPMIFARLQNDTEAFEELKDQFIGLSKGSPYWNDAVEICKQIEKMRLSPLDTSSIDLLIERMVARSRVNHSVISTDIAQA